MSANKELQELIELANQSQKTLDLKLSVFSKTMQNVLQNVSEEEKKQVEKIQSLTNKVINLSKEGKINEVNEILKQFSHGSKGN